MASNPMQRRARISFILGMLVTLVIAAIIIFMLLNQTKTIKNQLQAELNAKREVYVLTKDVASGQTITSDMFQRIKVSNTAIPADASMDIVSTLASYALSDTDGNTIYTEVNEKGEPSMYMDINNQRVTVTKDDSGKYYKNNDEEIELAQKPLLFKIDLKANTVMTGNMIVRSDRMLANDHREQTYNMVALPIDLVSGEYVDIRLMLPNGTDFIVLPKMEVTIPEVNGQLLSDTIKINVNEEELLTMSCAIVEAYKIEGSKLYAIKYKEAGIQDAAQVTYKPSSDTVTLIKNDPNVVNRASKALYNALANSYREKQIDQYSKNGQEEKVTSGIQQSTQSTQQARQEYLTSIYGGTVTTSGAGGAAQ